MTETLDSAMFARISAWVDGSYVGVDPETALWRRVTKVAEEAGEVVSALGGYVGENPRKGCTHTLDDLIGELLDTASAALCAVEHLTGNEGRSVGLFAAKVQRTVERAGLAALTPTEPTSEGAWR